MSDYCKAELKASYSENADFSDPEVDTFNWEPFELTTPTKGEEQKISAPSSGPQAVSLAAYTSVDLFAVKNLDPTNYVTLVFKSVGGGGGAGTTQTLKIPAGALTVLADVVATVNPTLQANGAACKCKVFIAGT